MSAIWKVAHTDNSKQDYANIIRWTANNFGPQQTRVYKQTILLALDALKAGPGIIGVKQRDDLGAGIHALHIARNGRKGRHFILFRIAQPDTIQVLRILHDSMDLSAQRTD